MEPRRRLVSRRQHGHESDVSLPLHRKLGYDHMLEMREIEAALRAKGLSGTALHFAAVEEHERRHADDPTFRQMQDAARARGAGWVAPMDAPNREDLFRRALERIRDGHNDPRRLAHTVLIEGKLHDAS